MTIPSPSPAAPSRRARVARALDSIGLLDRLLWMRGRVGPRVLTTLTYHRVARRADVTFGDPNLVEAEPDAFAEHLEILKAHGTPITIPELRAHFRGRPLPKNPVLVTFDDGYLEDHDVALPLLRRAGVPATFFIPTSYPESGRMFWWDRIAVLMRRCPLPSIEIAYPRRATIAPRRDPDAAAQTLCAIVKHTPDVDLARLWEELEAATGVAVSREEERALAARTIMSWSEIRALAGAGMDVESHSHAHMVLNTLSPEAARLDLRRSREVLRDAIGRDSRAVAYPVGYHLGAAHRDAVGAVFDLGFTNATGFTRVGALDPLDLPRLSMDLDKVGAAFKLLLLSNEREPAPRELF